MPRPLHALVPLALLLALVAIGCGGAPPAPTDTTPPAPPSGLTAVAGDGSVALGWTANDEADLARYRILQGETAADTEVGTVDAGTESYLASGLTNGTTYRFAVIAEDAGGNASQASAEVSATPQSVGADTTPPTVVSIEPTDGATGVARNASLRVTFSEPMLQGDLTVSPAADAPCARSWNPDTTVLTCQWPSPLAADTTYTVTIGDDTRDLAGNPIASDVTSSFTTGSDSNPVCRFDDAATPFGACVFGN